MIGLKKRFSTWRVVPAHVILAAHVVLTASGAAAQQRDDCKGFPSDNWGSAEAIISGHCYTAPGQRAEGLTTRLRYPEPMWGVCLKNLTDKAIPYEWRWGDFGATYPDCLEAGMYIIHYCPKKGCGLPAIIKFDQSLSSDVDIIEEQLVPFEINKDCLNCLDARIF